MKPFYWMLILFGICGLVVLGYWWLDNRGPQDPRRGGWGV